MKEKGGERWGGGGGRKYVKVNNDGRWKEVVVMVKMKKMEHD